MPTTDRVIPSTLLAHDQIDLGLAMILLDDDDHALVGCRIALSPDAAYLAVVRVGGRRLLLLPLQGGMPAVLAPRLEDDDVVRCILWSSYQGSSAQLLCRNFPPLHPQLHQQRRCLLSHIEVHLLFGHSFQWRVLSLCSI